MSVCVHTRVCAHVLYVLPPGPSGSPGMMKTPPVLVWWCQWSGPATLALCAFGLQWEVHSLDTHTHTHTRTFHFTAAARYRSVLLIRSSSGPSKVNQGRAHRLPSVHPLVQPHHNLGPFIFLILNFMCVLFFLIYSYSPKTLFSCPPLCTNAWHHLDFNIGVVM